MDAIHCLHYNLLNYCSLNKEYYSYVLFHIFRIKRLEGKKNPYLKI